jgi:hypothetical protein
MPDENVASVVTTASCAVRALVERTKPNGRLTVLFAKVA